MTKSVWSWALYDWANSAFATTVMAGFFPLFFKAYWADPGDPHQSTFYLGMTNSLGSILIACFAPFLGSVADKGSAKKKFLAVFAFFGAAMTGGLWLVDKGQWQLAALLYMGATMGFMGGNTFYDALLPAVASEDRVDAVSSLGYAMGYVGGGVLFALNVLMYLKPLLFGIPDGATAIKISFLMVAVWWALFTLPVLFFVKEPEVKTPVSLGKLLAQGWSQLRQTFREVRRYRHVGWFLLAYWLYMDGVDTIVRMAIDYGMTLGFPSSSLIQALLLVQFVAFPSALAYGWLAGKIGTKPAILLAIAAYGVITLLGYAMKTVAHFYLLAVMVGLFQGGIQALSRSLYSQIIPKDKTAEFFGFYNMLGKFAAVFGPAIMGVVTLVTRDPRLGILSILVLFIAGGIVLSRVDIAAARRAV